MQLAVCRLAALDIEAWHLSAKGVRTTLVMDVHHSVPGMLVAVGRLLAALDIEAREPRARVM